MIRFEPHSHSDFSNLRLIDCINTPKKLIDRALELGLAGIALTDHETVAGHMDANIYAKEIEEKNPDFKVALGNEIYLCETRDKKQQNYHFILIAKNKIGQRALRELSSRAWMNSFKEGPMERVITLYSDLEEIVNKYPNSLIATSACLGGQVSAQTLKLIDAEQVGDKNSAAQAHDNIVKFILFCKELFKEDFYIECAPGCSMEQVAVNKRLKSVAEAFGLKMVVGTDAHYLTKEDRSVHKAYLQSKQGEREVDAFYEYSYLQDYDEIIKHLSKSGYTPDFITEMFDNSIEIYNKIEKYDLTHKQQIPKVQIEEQPKENKELITKIKNDNNSYPTLEGLAQSENNVDRYWVKECINKLDELNLINDEYLSRLEEEARIKKIISEKLETNMFSYPVTLQHYVDMFWECGSLVGAGRGSSCAGLNHYLLGITQLDPIKWNLPFYRYLNEERVELGDIDLDLCPSKRPKILKEIKKERGNNFNQDIDELSKEHLGCTLIATFGTESAKSAILAACRGYRSDDYPDGIDPDNAQYLSSLVPIERGFVWSLHDIIEGNKEKGRKPVKLFINELKKYPGLKDILYGIEGLKRSRGSHASGVIMFDEDPYEFGCFMKTPKGDIVTQYDLHMAEAAGMTKYDFLVTEVQDKIVQTIEFLKKDNLIENDLSLREIYNKYLHPSVLPIEEDDYWSKLHRNEILDVFQFDSEIGAQAAKKIKPHSIFELSDANGLMRLMTAEKGGENPMDKYIRFKNNIELWYGEMEKYGLTIEEQETLKPYFLKSHGVPPSQEQMMEMLMDENICGFTLGEANSARKIVGKKLMDKIPDLKKKVLDQATSEQLGKYIWEQGISLQMGYAFSLIHSLAYSFIGFQTLYLATHWNPIYWDTACLVVNSGSLEEEEKDENKKEKSTNYGKVAQALNNIITRGINVSLVDINKSDFGFVPDAKNNKILYGMKALPGVNEGTIEEIKNKRPYSSLKDFMKKCKFSKTIMVSLIKSGAFDNISDDLTKDTDIEPRHAAMAYYLMEVGNLKKRLTLQNFNGLIKDNVFDKETLSFEKQVFAFNKYLKGYRKVGKYYTFDDNCLNFFTQKFENEQDKMEVINGIPCIKQPLWDSIYQNIMDTARKYLKEHQQELLRKYNEILFKQLWDKYADGSLSKWEMDSVSFYFHPHELIDVDSDKYGLINFSDLSSKPEVDYYFKRNGRNIPIFKTFLIMGTVISKNDTRHTVSILTVNKEVVTIKFSKDYYAMYARQISEMQETGVRKVMEKGWFQKGTKILCTGFRRDDMFVTKSYANTPTHMLYKIIDVENGSLKLTHDRYTVTQGEVKYEEI